MKLIVAVDACWAIGKDGGSTVLYPPGSQAVSAADHRPSGAAGTKDPGHLSRGRPLKNRRNLILSTDPAFAPAGGEVFATLKAALAAAPADTFVIGGASVYRQALAYCDTAYVTQIHRAFPAADCYFPNLAADPAWEAVETEGPYRYEDLAYTYVTYRRR